MMKTVIQLNPNIWWIKTDKKTERYCKKRPNNESSLVAVMYYDYNKFLANKKNEIYLWSFGTSFLASRKHVPIKF